MSNPKAISDPHAGQYQVVVSFRTAATPAHIDALVRRRLGQMLDLTVHIRRIGAHGETSADEGRWDAPGPATDVDAGRRL